jgi:crotonobetainyl-CoA:carnitine CoA-transferase CaiB-like acyl-CoA transferase
MTDVMKGIRVLEVAEHTFVPAASAVLADWGAEVIKVEHAERGDAMRSLGRTGVIDLSQGVHVILEHSNRGKKSIGIDLQTAEGLEVLHALVKVSDVFLTNKLPHVLEKLKIGVEALRAHNPKLIYARGTAFGPKGPDAARGGYDMTSFWCRAGSAASCTPPGLPGVIPQPGPAYGDSIGGMTIAGGISAALLKRERTGEPSVVDVSLLSTGTWAMAAGVAMSLQTGQPWAMPTGGGGPGNALVGLYPTSDGRFISVVMLQGHVFWADFCQHLGREAWISDERFATPEAFTENAAEARAEIGAEMGKRTLAEWTERFATLSGQWAPVQNTLEVAADPQVRANGYIQATETKEGVAFELAASPVQFDERPTETARSPEFNEHGDEILQELGYDWEKILALKAGGAVT